MRTKYQYLVHITFFFDIIVADFKSYVYQLRWIFIAFMMKSGLLTLICS